MSERRSGERKARNDLVISNSEQVTSKISGISGMLRIINISIYVDSTSNFTTGS